MKTRRDRKVPLFTLLLALGMSMPAASAWAARLVAVLGDVSIAAADDAQWRALPAPPYDLAAGDQLRTKVRGKAQIVWADGSYVRISENTDVALVAQDLDSAILRLVSGSLHVSFPSRAATGLQIRVAGATITAGDGSFVVSADAEGSVDIEVFSGAVVVETPNSAPRGLRAREALWIRPGSPVRIDTVLTRREPGADAGGGHRSPPDLPKLLDEMEGDPENLSTKAAINAAVNELYLKDRKISLTHREPLTAATRQSLLFQTYRLLINRPEAEPIRAAFLEGLQAMERGQYLVATESFQRCRERVPQPVWLAQTLTDILSTRIPLAVAAKYRTRPLPFAQAYQSAYRALERSDWAEVNRVLEGFISRLPAKPLRSSEQMDLLELIEMSKRNPSRSRPPGGSREALPAAAETSPAAPDTLPSDASQGMPPPENTVAAAYIPALQTLRVKQ